SQDSERTKRAGERIMVALSKPSTSHYLMDLGIALNGQDARSPLFPLAILSDNATDAESDSRQHAETMLAAAIMQGVSAQVSVIPVSRVSINIAQGILDSATEQNADTIIIGWNRPPKLSNAFFGSVIDQIVTGGNQMVFVARAVAPFSAAHIVAIVPSLCDRHPGFQRAAVALGALSKKNQAKLHIVTLHGQGSPLSQSFKDAGYSGPIQTIEVESWKEIGKGLKQIPAAPKLFALLSARPSEPSWHPAIERLPHRIGEEFPDSNLVMIYLAGQLAFAPPTPADGGKAATGALDQKNEAVPRPFSSTRILENAVSHGTIRVNMSHSAIADGVFELVSSAFPFDRKLSSRLGTKLTEIVQRQPIEIEPGVVLIHDRVPGIDEPILCLGSHRKGFRISLLDKPVQVLIILFVPDEESPEDHLAFLGEIAHLFKEKALAQHLLEADTPKDLL
ncbi:MAG TPA: universal stress protein, partial [Rectinemataceae bacterium]|nr:universal stress protein [Rectinemataceae bacterium]